MDPQLHGPTQRRSSIAYDPARDTFIELPSNISEGLTSSIMSAPPSEARKRSRSNSAKHTEDQNGTEPPQKKHKSSENGESTPNSDGQPAVRPAIAKGPRIPKIAREEGEVGGQRPARTPATFTNRRPDARRDNRARRRSRSPGASAGYRRRSPLPQKRDPSRSPSPIRASPPRNLPRPGGARGKNRNLLQEQERLRAEREQRNGESVVNRGVQGVSNQWYNAVPEYSKERGRDWRKTDSQIKGLRSFNNWVKSCIIQKFSPQDKQAVQEEELGWGETAKEPEEIKPLRILDIGCGKGGDLQKWDKSPQPVELYVGLDPADQSIDQARDRYRSMCKGRYPPRFDARFVPKDCFGEWLGDVPIIQEIGIDPTPNSMNRWGKGGGFDIVTMMFTMHYAFESQEKVEMMLRNASGALKKGGRLIGVCPNSDVISDKVKDWFKKNPGKYGEEAPEWKNSIYSVRFPPPSASLPALSADGSFRPPFTHKYTYYIAEAVDVPEFVVPWEAFRSIAENYGLDQRYRKSFLDIWDCETDPKRATNTGAASTGGWGEPEVGDSTALVARKLEDLAVKMGVIKHPGGPLQMSEEEKEAVSFYHGFCFVKN